MTTEFKHVPQDGKDITEADIKKIIKEENVKFIELQFVDINGQVKSLTIPSEHIDKALENGEKLTFAHLEPRGESLRIK